MTNQIEPAREGRRRRVGGGMERIRARRGFQRMSGKDMMRWNGDVVYIAVLYVNQR